MWSGHSAKSLGLSPSESRAGSQWGRREGCLPPPSHPTPFMRESLLFSALTPCSVSKDFWSNTFCCHQPGIVGNTIIQVTLLRMSPCTLYPFNVSLGFKCGPAESHFLYPHLSGLVWVELPTHCYWSTISFLRGGRVTPILVTWPHGDWLAQTSPKQYTNCKADNTV